MFSFRMIMLWVMAMFFDFFLLQMRRHLVSKFEIMKKDSFVACDRITFTDESGAKRRTYVGLWSISTN